MDFPNIFLFYIFFVYFEHILIYNQGVMMGWVNGKGLDSLQKFEEGGEVKKKTLRNTATRRIIEKKDKKGTTEVTVYMDSPTKQVGGEGGGKRRMYKGTASSSSPTLSTPQLSSISQASSTLSAWI